jgi:hypothetical protein
MDIMILLGSAVIGIIAAATKELIDIFIQR